MRAAKGPPQPLALRASICLRAVSQSSAMHASPAPVPEAHRAPFAPGGATPMDPDTCRKLLTIALSRGGDYADLFFEYRGTASMSFEEGITRSAARGTSVGMGVRVQKGEATGYAHVEDLS